MHLLDHRLVFLGTKTQKSRWVVVGRLGEEGGGSVTPPGSHRPVDSHLSAALMVNNCRCRNRTTSRQSRLILSTFAFPLTYPDDEVQSPAKAYVCQPRLKICKGCFQMGTFLCALSSLEASEMKRLDTVGRTRCMSFNTTINYSLPSCTRHCYWN